MEWLQQILRHVRQGRHAFIITGNIGDGFPNERGAEPDALVPWYDVVTSVLRSAKPEHLCWTFDPARGFLLKDKEDEQALIDLLTPEEEKADKKKKKSDDDDVVGDLRRQMDGMEEGLPAAFVQAMPLTLQAFVAAACAKDEKLRRPCVALFHDADAVWNGQMSDERVTRAFLAMQRIAEGDGFRRAGHIFMVAAPSATSLPERFRRADSPFTIIRVTRPNFDDRVKFLGDLVVDESLCERLEELHAAKRQRDQEAGEKLTQDIIDAEAEVVRQTDAPTEDAELRTAEKKLVAAEKAFEQSTTQWRTSQDERLAKLRAIDAELADCDPEAALSAETVRNARTGDVIEYRKDNDVVRSQRKTVLKASAGDLHLSLSTDATQVMTNPKDDDRPVIFYWGTEGFSQRQTSAKTGKAIPVPEDTRLILIPKKRHGLLTQKVDMERAIKEAEAQRAKSTTLSDELDAARVQAESLRAAWTQEKRQRIEAAREHLEHLKAMKAMGQTSAGKDLESERLEQELLAGRYPPPACGIPEMARYSQGLGYRDIVQMFRAAQRDGKTCDATTVLAERHNALARSYGHLVEIVKPSYGFDGIAGLDGIKRFLGSVRDDIAKGMNARVPMGCLLMGPPGTGKTAIAEAFAEECGFLFVKIRNTRSMWVGETERQMEELVAGLRELAPVVVLRDEVDQEDTGRDSFQGDSGVSARVRQKWMEFLSDPAIRGRVFVISCSNRPDLLDAALKRSGRTDERIPVLMPDAVTRKRLFPVMLKRAQKSLPGVTVESKLTKDDLNRLAEMTEDLSGADIEVIVRHGIEYAKVEGNKVIVDGACMERAAKDFMPSDSSVQIAKMTISAISSCARREFLPPNVQEIIAQCAGKLGIKLAKKDGAKEDASLESIIDQVKASGKMPSC